jgi:hypothetical protein
VISAEEFETALHNAGIWTAEDVQSKSREALGALQLVYGVDLGNILKATQEHVETKKSETAKKPAITKRKTSKKEEDNA